MTPTDSQIDLAIAAIAKIAVVPTILEIASKVTGMGFAAIARDTDEKWVACSVRDEIKFGLLPGGELKLDTTICHEIRQSGTPVVIDHVAEDVLYARHHTPRDVRFPKLYFGANCPAERTVFRYSMCYRS